MVLSSLENLLDINFNPDIDIEVLNFTRVESDDKFQKEGETLNLNLAALEPQKREEVVELAKTQFQDEGRVLRHEEEDETQAIERGYDDSMDEILEYFEGVLTDRYLRIIESGLYLRALIEEREVSKEEIQQKKREIARRHGPEAVYLTSLVTAGYFDPDGGLRDLYVDMGLNEQYDRYKFQQELDWLAEQKLLCLFVENDDAPVEITQTARGRLSKYQREEPIQDWFDIRGIGNNCEDIIEQVMENLENEFMGIDYDRWTHIEDEMIIRIYPQSLPTISE